ncbi:MAG: uracil-DNA glycosylase, partial [Promethearchaeota archaeon]
ANIIKSYLPDNKATKEQIASCTPYLDKQIDLIKPKIIILLGNVAVKYIFEKYQLPLAPMRDLHTKIFIISTLDFSAKIIPMYHPSAALRNPGLRDVIIEDWVKLKEKLH